MQLKKIFAILLVATLFCSVFAVNTNAEDFETLKVGVVAESTAPIFDTYPIYNKGDEVSFKISVDQNPGVSTVYMWVSFDTSAFEYVSHTSAGLFAGKENFSTSFLSSGNFQYKFDLGKSSTTNTGDLFTLTLRVKETKCGDTDITTMLRSNEPKNCILYTGDSSSPTKVVPFEGGKTTVTIHNIESVDAKEPTCTEVGWDVHDACKDCEYSQRVDIDPLGHRLENVIAKLPTCTEGGWDKHTECARCGEKSVHLTYSPLGHTPEEAVRENIVEATCTDTGSYDSVVYCAVCDVEISREFKTIDALGHRLENVIAKEPTCTEGGWDKHTECARCGEKSPHLTFAPVPHTPAEALEENRIEPTCTNDGSYDSVVYCAVCNSEISRESKKIDALGHRLENVIAKDPTCTEAGWDKHTECARCGEKSPHFTFAPLGHKPEAEIKENVIKATCTQDGSYDNVVYCSVCDAEISRVTITVDAYGHTPEIAVRENFVEATCETAGGYDEVVYCSVCDVEISRNKVVIDAYGHNYTFVSESVVEPTCTDDGKETKNYICETCGKNDERVTVIPAVGHNYIKCIYEPSCTDDGYTEYICKLCDDKFYDNYVTATGHAYGDVEIIAPTYETEGYSKHSCEKCGFEEKFDFVPVLSFISGDVNGDGDVNNRDLAMLMRYLNDFEAEIVGPAADVNANGIINNKDYAILMQYLNGWEVELH